MLVGISVRSPRGSKPATTSTTVQIDAAAMLLRILHFYSAVQATSQIAHCNKLNLYNFSLAVKVKIFF